MRKEILEIQELAKYDKESLTSLKEKILFVLQNYHSEKNKTSGLIETPHLTKFYELLRRAISLTAKRSAPNRIQTFLHTNPKLYQEIVNGLEELNNIYEDVLPQKEDQKMETRLGFYRLFFYLTLDYMFMKGIPISFTTILRQIPFFPDKLQKHLPYAGTGMMYTLLQKANKLPLRRNF